MRTNIKANTPLYKYYAIRVGDVAIIRRTLKTLYKVTSSLKRPGSNLLLVQVSYTGGKVVGSLPYMELYKRYPDIRLGLNDCIKLDRNRARALRPFLTAA